MMKKLIASAFGLALVLSASVAFAQIAPGTFTRSLTVGSTGADVVALQTILEAQGDLVMPLGVAKGYFGPLTRTAVAKWQARVGIVPPAGYFGPISIARISSVVVPPPTGLPAGCTSTAGFSPISGVRCDTGSSLPAGCTSTAGFSSTTGVKCDSGGSPSPSPSGPLTGGAGSIEDADFVSGIQNEEVGEDSENIKVAGLTIEADDNSDIEITAVRLDFDQSTGATADFEDYAKEVSVWFGDKEVARLDASEFNDANNFDKTISLDSGAIIRAGKTGDLFVKIDGIGNIDSSDAGDTWTLIFTQVRFEDADGAVLTDTSTGDIGTETRTLTFETFATAVDTEFKITDGDDAINDSHIIVVDSSNDTDNVPILSYNVEIKGTGDVTVQDLPVGILVATQDNVDEMISGLTLFMDGVEVGSASMSSNCIQNATDCDTVGTYEAYLFDDMGLTLEGGKKYAFVVKADFYPTTGTGDLAEGDTIQASTTAAMIELGTTYADIEDESGEDLVAADISGTANSDASPVYVTAIDVDFVSASAVDDNASLDTSTGDDTGKYTIVFDVTAFGADLFIDGDVVATTSSDANMDTTFANGNVDATSGLFFGTTTNTTTNFGTSTTLSVLESSSTDSDDVTTAGQLSFQVEEDQTRRFTLTIEIPATSDGQAGVRLRGISWDTESGDVHDTLYRIDLGDFKTGVLNLNQQP